MDKAAMVKKPQASTQFSGTITFLFTDIEGSTRLWEMYPAAMKPALALHDDILRTAIESNQGQLIKTTGDGAHAGFPNALDAVNATLSAQRQFLLPLGDLQLKVRMAVYTGEAEMRAGDYYGTAVNRAARLMSAAHGGQILVSNATAELLRDQMPQDAALRDLGEHRLKDLARPEHVFQLTHPSLPDEFPPLKSIDSFPNNLPIQLSTFVGREKEIGEIKSLLRTNRLVTLTGSGGTGKTRLALEVGTQELEVFAHGVWMIELAPLSEPAQIIPALARAFGLQEPTSTPLADLVANYLRSKQMLLMLDNCEHLIEACARLAEDLLHECPRLKILTSSREALGIAGEIAYHTPSLKNDESTRLFVDRARAANPKFSLTDANAPAIAAICTRLDGIPLAIELAAARTRLMTPEQIAARLGDRFSLLVGGNRTALPRQQTLRALIDWSYDLLAVDEKRLLQFASVFVGGWTLDAFETVTEDPNAIENLEQLVNKSLVVTEESGPQMRFSLLETIRQYAREKLLDSGVTEVKRARSRHLNYFVKMAEAAVAHENGPEVVEVLDELELEQDNLRAAVEWSIENDPLSALRIAVILPMFWGRRLSASEGYSWVKKALIRAEESFQPESTDALPYLNARATALLGEAAMAFQLGDNLAARTAIETSITLARKINHTETLAHALAMGATICAFLGDVHTAQTWSQEAISLSRQHGFAYVLATSMFAEMLLAAIMDQPLPPGFEEETLRLARVSGNPWSLTLALTNIGRRKMASGQWVEAAQFLNESASLAKKIRGKSMYNMCRSEMGHLLRKQGNYAEAVAVYRETIQAYQDLGHRAAIAHELECLAFIAGAQNQMIRAATFLGAAEALRELIKSDMIPMEHREYDTVVSSLSNQMDGEEWANAWAEGRAMPMEQAIELALAS